MIELEREYTIFSNAYNNTSDTALFFGFLLKLETTRPAPDDEIAWLWASQVPHAGILWVDSNTCPG